MSEKQNFLRIVKAMYGSITPTNYLENLTKIEKLKELNRFLNEFDTQTKNIEKMLNTYIQLGILSIQDKEEMIEAIKEINGEYFNDISI